MGKFRQVLTELSAHHPIVTGYYRFTFLLDIFKLSIFFCISNILELLFFSETWKAEMVTTL